MNFMETTTPRAHSEEMIELLSSVQEERMCEVIAIPLQKMFDEFMVFIAKTDFE